MEKQAVFLRDDVKKLLRNKFIVILGDSVQRSLYKDLVVLLQENRFLLDNELRKKGEVTFCNDELLEGGIKGELNNGTSYREVRQYKTDYILIRFYFLTRVYGPYMETVLKDLMEEPKPDVVIINSCLWDITRYGPSSIPKYKTNLEELFKRFPQVLPPQAMVVWNTTLPVSSNIKGGFMVPEVAFMNDTLRLDILEANYYTRDIVVSNGYDVLDLHYYFRWQLHRRAGDGVHWNERAHRRITNLVLAHLATAWGVGVPRLIGPDPVVRDNMIRLIRSQSAIELDFHSRANLSVHGPRNGVNSPPNMFSRQVFMHPNNGFNPQNNRFNLHNNGFSPENNGFSPQNNGFNLHNNGFSPENNGFSPQNNGFNPHNNGFNMVKSPEERYGGPIRRTNYRGGAPYMSPHMASQQPFLLQNQNMPPLPYVDFSRAIGNDFNFRGDFNMSPPLQHQQYRGQGAGGKIINRMHNRARQGPGYNRFTPYGGVRDNRNVIAEKNANACTQEVRNQ
ncbi:PC-esterase domain-containing protein 1A-like [Glandiceps talaboti]